MIESRFAYLAQRSASIEKLMDIEGLAIFDGRDPRKSPQSVCLRQMMSVDLLIVRHALRQLQAHEERRAAMRGVRILHHMSKREIVAMEQRCFDLLAEMEALYLESAPAGGVN